MNEKRNIYIVYKNPIECVEAKTQKLFQADVLVFLIAMIFLLVSCSPSTQLVTTEIVTVKITATQLPTSTYAPEPTNTPEPSVTPTETPVPTLEGLSIPVLDPRQHPEFKKLFYTEEKVLDGELYISPIIEFANAFDLDPVEVVTELKPELLAPEGKNIVFRTTNGVALMIAKQDEKGNWIWQSATPGNYWREFGKSMGLYMEGEESKNSNYQELVESYFKDGILSLAGQVRPNAEPERPPSNANKLAGQAQKNRMNLFIQYIAEPGKFPLYVNTSNVDSWLASRFEGFAQVIKNNKTADRPAYISFNEAWEGDVWNEEYNPLRQKYGEQWIQEYIYLAITLLINEGLVPNEDFILVFNDANLYNRPHKQDLVYETLSEARSNAFSKLMSDKEMKTNLNEFGINKVDDLEIILGVQTHTQLDGKRDDGFFIPPPSDEEIINLSGKFDDLGGVIMTEVNPEGTAEQQEEFVKRISSLLPNVPAVKGIIWWNIFKDSNDTPDQIFERTVLEFFNEEMTPTRLYYALLTIR